MDPPTTSPTTTTTTTTSGTTSPPTTTPPTTTPPTTTPPTTTPPTTTPPTSLPPSTTSEPPSTTSAPPSTTSLPTTSSSVATSTTTSHLTTITSQVTVTPSSSPTTIAGGANGAKDKGFFDNKGAVAGVFTVVGLVGLAILIALVTNVIRRRRAKQFDREIAEAAEEAAKAPAPVFLDDEDDNYGPRGGAAAGYGGRGEYDDYGPGGYGNAGPYSDVSSHGTYSQPPMTTTGESYNMHDMGGQHGGGAPGELYNPYAAAAVGGAAGAAGVGVARARSTRDPGNFAAGLTQGSSPYAAFAGPGYNQQEYGGYNNNNAYGAAGGYNNHGPGSPEYDLLDAAGMTGGNSGNGSAAVGAAAGAANVQRGMSLNHQQESQLPYTGAGPQRSHSTGNRSAESGNSASVYTTPSANYPSGAGASGPAPPVPHQDYYAGGYTDQDDPYGGYAGDQHSRSGHGHAQHVVGDAESDGEDDTHHGARVLRVANE